MNIEKENWISAALNTDSNECLLWPFGKTSAGYGVIYWGRKQQLVHRYICEVKNGTAAAGKTDVAHNCGNGHLGCANPRHLRWASRSENMQDRRIHGTSRCGEDNHYAKLNERQVREILSSSEISARLAERFGVSRSLVSMIKKRKVWAHL